MRRCALVIVMACESASPPPSASPPAPPMPRAAATIDAGGGRIVVTTTDECGFILDMVYFARESSEISPMQAQVVVATAEMFRCFARTGEITRWQVIGYTDDAERHGAELAHARAQAVIDALVARGVSANSLEAVSAAATDPLDRRGTPDARAKNRRVAFLRSR